LNYTNLGGCLQHDKEKIVPHTEREKSVVLVDGGVDGVVVGGGVVVVVVVVVFDVVGCCVFHKIFACVFVGVSCILVHGRVEPTWMQ
jgi:hypothetical protein